MGVIEVIVGVAFGLFAAVGIIAISTTIMIAATAREVRDE